MDYKSINLNKAKNEDLIASLLSGEFILPTSKELKKLQDIIKTSILQGKFNISLNALSLGLYFDEDNTINNIKKKGLFRYSKFISNKCIIKDLSTKLEIIYRKFCRSSENVLLYFNSISNLSPIHEIYNNLTNTILSEVKLFKRMYPNRSIVKSLLAYIDYLFLIDYKSEVLTDVMSLESRQKEAICEAISYIIFFVLSNKQLKSNSTTFVSEDYVIDKEYKEIINAACLISDLKEYEVKIDCFNYSCEVNKSEIMIKPPNEDFEKCLNLGYIKHEIQPFDPPEEIEDAYPFAKLVEEIKNIEGITYLKYTETYNYPRYRLEIPEIVYDKIVDDLFVSDDLFKEEVIYLAYIFKEQLLDLNDIKTLNIRGGLTIIDFVKIRRVFELMYQLFSKQLLEKEGGLSHLFVRSSIISMTKEEIHKFLGKFAKIEKINTLLDMISWSPEKEQVFDLQYHPFIYVNGVYLFSYSVLINSNYIRNLYASEYKQNNNNLIKDGTSDSLVTVLVEGLSNVNIQSFTNTSVPNSEIDIFGIINDTLLFFECKHSLHPVSIYDLRTTFDYIKKAESQLDNINALYNSGKLIRLLESKCGIDLSKINKTISCIVLSNRMFYGYNFKYPVRNIHEIRNLLNGGIIRTNQGKFRMWTTDKLTLRDIEEYFSKDNALHRVMKESLSKYTLTYKFEKNNIIFDTFYFDPENVSIKIKEYTDKLKILS